MNVFIRYLNKGLKFSFICLLLVILSQYINIFLIFIFLIFIFLIYNFLNYNAINYNNNTNSNKKLQIFSNKLTNKYNINKVYIKLEKLNGGILIYKILKPNILYIPEETESIDESKVIISHEIGHIVNNDLLKYSFLYLLLIFFSVQILYYTYSSIKFTIIFLFLMTIFIPYILNYVNHQFEYNADKFAIEHTSAYLVSKRLRKNNQYKSINIKYLPYLNTHPSTEKRLHNIIKY